MKISRSCQEIKSRLVHLLEVPQDNLLDNERWFRDIAEFIDWLIQDQIWRKEIIRRANCIYDLAVSADTYIELELAPPPDDLLNEIAWQLSQSFYRKRQHNSTPDWDDDCDGIVEDHPQLEAEYEESQRQYQKRDPEGFEQERRARPILKQLWKNNDLQRKLQGCEVEYNGKHFRNLVSCFHEYYKDHSLWHSVKQVELFDKDGKPYPTTRNEPSCLWNAFLLSHHLSTVREKAIYELKESLGELNNVLDVIDARESRDALKNSTSKDEGKKRTTKAIATEWKQIEIEVVDDGTIKFKTKETKWNRANCVELGFLDERNHLPKKLWSIFLGLASKNLPLHTSRPKMKPKDIDRIRKTLRNYFGIKEIPIEYDCKAKEYRCKFSFSDPREW